MGYLTTDCPECGATSVGMPLFGTHLVNPNMFGGEYKKWFGFAAIYCGKCLTPFGVKVEPGKDRNIPEHNALLQEAFKHPADVNHFDLKWKLVTVMEKAPGLEHLPPKVQRALTQADANLERPGCEEPAAVFYGRAIELAIKYAHPNVGGTLAQRIAKLATDRVIPQAMADWATEVRVVRNDGAHDDGVTREDVIAARDFADAFLRYLITMPAMVAARRPSVEPEAAG